MQYFQKKLIQPTVLGTNSKLNYFNNEITSYLCYDK